MVLRNRIVEDHHRPNRPKALMLPYDLILLAAAVVLSMRHVGSMDASNRSKQLIVGLLALSFVLPRLSIAPGVAALLFQGGICAYLIFREIYAAETNDQR